MDQEPPTYRQHIAEAEERSLLIATATDDIIWDWDLKSGELAFSSKVAKFGFDDWAADGTIAWWERHIHPDDREATIAATASAIRNGIKSFTVEYRFCKADGEFAYIYDRAFVMHDADGVAVRAIGAMIDVTELRLAKQSLRKAENQLALVYRLNAMGTMGSMIAHELSQPLAAAANYTHAGLRLAARGDAADNKQLQNVLRAAEANMLRAGEIIRRLRQLVSKGKVAARATPLAQLIRDACNIVSDDAAAKGISFQCTTEPTDVIVWVDALQIQQVIINLVRNSVDALASTEKPEIIIMATRSSDVAEVIVQDNGEGVSNEVRDNLFSTVITGKSNGMGIGLSISRTIIEAQGGEIWLARSQPGRTEFRFTLPLLSSNPGIER